MPLVFTKCTWLCESIKGLYSDTHFDVSYSNSYSKILFSLLVHSCKLTSSVLLMEDQTLQDIECGTLG